MAKCKIAEFFYLFVFIRFYHVFQMLARYLH